MIGGTVLNQKTTATNGIQNAALAGSHIRFQCLSVSIFARLNMRLTKTNKRPNDRRGSRNPGGEGDIEMKITTLSYSELVSTGDYSNKKIGASCELSDGEKPEEAFVNLVYWVRDQFFKIGVNPPEIQAVEDRLRVRQDRLNQLEYEIEQMQKRWNRAADFLEKHGVSVPENEIPF